MTSVCYICADVLKTHGSESGIPYHLQEMVVCAIDRNQAGFPFAFHREHHDSIRSLYQMLWRMSVTQNGSGRV